MTPEEEREHEFLLANDPAWTTMMKRFDWTAIGYTVAAAIQGAAAWVYFGEGRTLTATLNLIAVLLWIWNTGLHSRNKYRQGLRDGIRLGRKIGFQNGITTERARHWN